MGELLKGKNAVVTGAGRGIGKAIALALAEEGANVVVNDLGTALNGTGSSNSPADETVGDIKKVGGNAISNYDSVTEYESAGRIVKTCVDRFGSIDILVNSAGNYRNKMCLEMTPEEWDTVIRVHLYGTFFCSRHAIFHMIQHKWGRIISATSDAYRGQVGSVNYSAAKGGIVSFMRSLAMEVAPYGITCNCFAPGASTRMTTGDEAREKYKKGMEAGAMSREMFERLMDIPSPEFVAPIVAYLASEYGASINGSVLSCMGGKIGIHNVAGEVRAIYKDYRKQGPWTMEEMRRLIPRAIAPYCPPLKGPEPDWG